MSKLGLLLRQFPLASYTLYTKHRTLEVTQLREGGEIRPRKEGKDNDNFIFKALPLPVRVPCLSYTGGEGTSWFTWFLSSPETPVFEKTCEYFVENFASWL